MDGLVEAGREPEYKWLHGLIDNFTKTSARTLSPS